MLLCSCLQAGITRPSPTGAAVALKAAAPRLRLADLTFGESLGQGTFADVCAGTYKRSKVAIKVIRNFDLPPSIPPFPPPSLLRSVSLSVYAYIIYTL